MKDSNMCCTSRGHRSRDHRPSYCSTMSHKARGCNIHCDRFRCKGRSIRNSSVCKESILHSPNMPDPRGNHLQKPIPVCGNGKVSWCFHNLRQHPCIRFHRNLNRHCLLPAGLHIRYHARTRYQDPLLMHSQHRLRYMNGGGCIRQCHGCRLSDG